MQEIECLVLLFYIGAAKQTDKMHDIYENTRLGLQCQTPALSWTISFGCSYFGVQNFISILMFLLKKVWWGFLVDVVLLMG